MKKIVAVCGSPRRGGNTATLLDRAVQGATDAGAEVERVALRGLKISPCLEIYKCKETGECAIRDDFQEVQDKILAADGLMLASPIFFGAFSAQTKAFIDRFQSLWVKKHWIDNIPLGKSLHTRKGLLISVGATKGAKLFDGALLTTRYFFNVLDMELWGSLLYRELDSADDAAGRPEHLRESYETGREFALAL